ncbi:MAG: hypothetical protein GWN67_28955 [Phycisphaerae bacterium]|nr:hypothetical protein [Phycisphaerae bacterium]NIP50877.1 hypothetical protein [Phycisphaerae bacterium]NIS54748.1 hypothetical protein [Phycisphaerae bacterium]NIU12348.1 hypothetical protein [Phycisphaerae bacterium]NIU60237.1 hypothetical protein [Phycisphaerae bacterium]
MEITKEQERQIDRIAGDMECPNGFVCRISKFEDLCKTRLIANGQLVECLEENNGRGKFKLPFGDSSLCKCHLRIYIAKNLHR